MGILEEWLLYNLRQVFLINGSYIIYNMYTYILQDRLLLTFKKNLEDLIFRRINF